MHNNSIPKEQMMSWVIKECETIVGDIQNAIASYGKDYNTALLQSAPEKLHQLKGVLQVLNCYGAALLVEDIQKTIDAIIEDRIKNQQETYQVLSLAIISLENYLDQLQLGQEDYAVAVLSLINDLRSTRDDPLITESALFSPDLFLVPVIPGDVLFDEGKQLYDNCRKLRPYFQSALLAWYRDQDDSLSIQQMKLVVRHLESSSTTPRLRQFWWIASGLLETIQDHGVKTSASLKLLLGKMDRVIKQIIRNGTQILEKHPPYQLMKNFLFYVAQSNSSGSRTKTLKQAYSLERLIPRQEEISNITQGLRKPSSKTLKQISAELIKNIEYIKADLDNFSRHRTSNANRLNDMATQLKHISDTLTLLGLGKTQHKIQQQINIINLSKYQGTNLDNKQLMIIASVILEAEMDANAICNSPIHKHHSGTVVKLDTHMGNQQMNKLPKSEYQQLLREAIIQAKLNIAEAKNHIMSYLASNRNEKKLRTVPQLLHEVSGCLNMTNYDYAAELVDAVLDFIQRKLLQTEITTTPIAQLDTLAESIVSIEYFLDAITEDNSEVPDILELARKSLQTLGYQFEHQQEHSENKQASMVTKLEKLVDMETRPSQEAVLVAHEADTRPQPPVQARHLPSSDELNELKEIFYQEAIEELALIGKNIDAMNATGYSNSGINTLKHALHTLRGSGKIAGAFDISQAAEMVTDFLEEHGEEYGVLLSTLNNARESLEQLVNNYISSLPSAHVLEELEQVLRKTVTAKTVDTVQTPQDVAELDKLDEEQLFSLLSTHASRIRDSIADTSQLTISADTISAVRIVNDIADKLQLDDLQETTDMLYRYLGSLHSNAQTLNQETREILGEFCDTTIQITRQALQDDSPEDEIQTQEVEIDADLDAAETVTAIDSVDTHHGKASTDSSINYSEQEDADFDLIEIFLEEAQELFDQSNPVFENLEQEVKEKDLEALQRILHTLKGSARMAGITAIGNLTHAIEALVETCIDKDQFAQKYIALTRKGTDALQDMVDALKANQDINSYEHLIDQIIDTKNSIAKGGENRGLFSSALDKTRELFSDSRSAYEEILNDYTIAQHSAHSSKEDSKTTTRPQQQSPAELEPQAVEEKTETEKLIEYNLQHGGDELQQARPADTGDNKSGEHIRVASETMEFLVNQANEERSINSRVTDNINATKNHLIEMDKTVTRLKDQLRDLEFEHDTGKTRVDDNNIDIDVFSKQQEIAKRLMEAVDDIANLHGVLTRLTLETDNLTHHQQRIHSDLVDTLINTRMISFTNQSHRLRRIIRQTCSELDKDADLVFEGTEGAMDKALLDKLISPLEHILRNAIAHGIEKPQQRLQAGKAAKGRVKIRFKKERSENVIIIEDDGAGIDAEKVKKKAIDLGIINPTDLLTEDEVINLIMESGFSTAEEVTQLAGRGVGMDAVFNDIQRLGGSIYIQTQQGKGTRFTIRLPFTMAMHRTVLVQVRDQIYAIPENSIESTQPASSTQLRALYEQANPVYLWNNHRYPIRYLDSLLNNTPIILPGGDSKASLLLIKDGEQMAALHVDRIIETRDSILKPAGPQLNKVKGVSGVTILSDGKVVLIIDVPAIVRLVNSSKSPLAEIRHASDEVNPNLIRAMVVDDSITVRKVTERFLKRHGMQTISAKDGIEAIDILEQLSPDVILLDIEMPKMDGLEFTKTIRAEQRWANLPIIMITSRSGRKHKEAALSLGVDVFLGKPYQENELIKHIERLTHKQIDKKSF